jgi:PASTA domain
MVEELLIASGKPRKAVFDEVEDEILEVAPLLEPSSERRLESSEGVSAGIDPSDEDPRDRSFSTLARGKSFGSLSRRRRIILVILSVLMVVLLLAWALPTMGSELASGVPFIDASARKAESSQDAPDTEAPDGPVQNPPSEAAGDGSSASGGAGRAEVPDVTDRGVVEAAEIISRAGFEVGAIKSVASQREAGQIQGTEPPAGSAVEPGTPIVIVMSGGPSGIPPGFRNGGHGGAAQTQYAN